MRARARARAQGRERERALGCENISEGGRSLELLKEPEDTSPTHIARFHIAKLKIVTRHHMSPRHRVYLAEREREREKIESARTHTRESERASERASERERERERESWAVRILAREAGAWGY